MVCPFRCSRLSGTREAVGTCGALWPGFRSGRSRPVLWRFRLGSAGGAPLAPGRGGAAGPRLHTVASVLCGGLGLTPALAPPGASWPLAALFSRYRSWSGVCILVYSPVAFPFHLRVQVRAFCRRLRCFLGCPPPWRFPARPSYAWFWRACRQPLCGQAPAHGFCSRRWLGPPGPPCVGGVRRS